MSLAQSILNTGFEAIISAMVANFLAQFIKFVKDWRKHRQMNLSVLFSTGGMPSSHSSGVTGLTTSVGLISGWNSPIFAVSFCYAVITMFDAAGLRRSASLQAMALNQIMRELFAPDHTLNRKRLKEFLGHTPREVMVGALLGVVISLLIHFWLLFMA
jgi:uncharacterized protein